VQCHYIKQVQDSFVTCCMAINKLLSMNMEFNSHHDGVVVGGGKPLSASC